MLKPRIQYLPKGHRNRPGWAMKPKGLLYHTTNNWNDGAGDEMHAEYMRTTTRVVSWHDTVDKDSWTRHIPHTENAWHAGDGGEGYYNRNFIGLEIACEAVKPGESLDKATYNNAVEAAASIMLEHGFTEWDQLQPHNIVYGKNCPHTTLFSRDQFKRDVFARMKVKAQPAKPTTTNKDVHIVVRGDSISKIAEMYNVPMDTIVRLNDLDDPSLIFPGQKIKLKGDPKPMKPKEPVEQAKDVIPGYFEAGYNEAVAAGISNGNRPNDPATRIEAMIMANESRKFQDWQLKQMLAVFNEAADDLGLQDTEGWRKKLEEGTLTTQDAIRMLWVVMMKQLSKGAK